MATKKIPAPTNGYAERNGFVVLTKDGTVLGPFDTRQAANNFTVNILAPGRDPEVMTYIDYVARKKKA